MEETILLVEDEEPIRALVREYLESSGYRVLVAENGPEALKLNQEHHGPIHLLLTDMMMPKMDGSVLASRLTTSRPDMKVLYISGHNPNISVHYSVLNPDTALLPKPFTQATLLSTIRSILNIPRR